MKRYGIETLLWISSDAIFKGMFLDKRSTKKIFVPVWVNGQTTFTNAVMKALCNVSYVFIKNWRILKLSRVMLPLLCPKGKVRYQLNFQILDYDVHSSKWLQLCLETMELGPWVWQSNWFVKLLKVSTMSFRCSGVKTAFLRGRKHWTQKQ